MKRCWFGTGALVVLLLLGLLSSRWMVRHNARISEAVSAIPEAAARDDWSSAAELAAVARRQWEAGRFLGAVLSDHAPREQVDTLLALLDTALARRDPAACADLTAQITQALKALGEAHQLSWENLL